MIPAGVFGVFYFILPMLIYFAKDSYPEVSILARGVGAPRLPPGLVCCRHITGALHNRHVTWCLIFLLSLKPEPCSVFLNHLHQGQGQF